MGVYCYLWCKACGVHLHVGKLKEEMLEPEDLGLTMKFFFLHLGHELKILSEADEDFVNIGEEWRG